MEPVSLPHADTPADPSKAQEAFSPEAAAVLPRCYLEQGDEPIFLLDALADDGDFDKTLPELLAAGDYAGVGRRVERQPRDYALKCVALGNVPSTLMPSRTATERTISLR